MHTERGDVHEHCACLRRRKGYRLRAENLSRERGYAVECAYDGAQALALLESRDISLVLMDIMMPVMDGISAMVKIRERSNVPP